MTANTSPRELSDNLFPVIGIGASAGGLAAFIRFIKVIPVQSGMAYVLVQHLDPLHKSILPELLQKVTLIPVREIIDNVVVEPDHIYIIPYNKMLQANDGVLELTPRTKGNMNMPIDLFFTSLAMVHQKHAIGVVLTGNGSDGTLGLNEIKKKGGITFAQTEGSSTHSSMPKSAADAGVADYIMAAEDMPAMLLEINQKIIYGNKNAPDETEESFHQEIFKILYERKGTDFTYYKRPTIRRRVTRRMAASKNSGNKKYLDFLKDNFAEQDNLYQELLIPVTSFFRDPKVFQQICKSVFEKLINDSNKSQPVRIWVAGCSTGQEAFSIAICLKELMGDKNLPVQIFATDISSPAIGKARKGIFLKSEMASVSEERTRKFFTETEKGFLVNRDIREMCVFALHDFLKNPPFGKIDFVSCRNVLIYMEPFLQKKALTTFHYSLNNGGLLLLGKSETGTIIPELFTGTDKNGKLFLKQNVPSSFLHVASAPFGKVLPKKETAPNNITMRADFQKTADELLLNKYSPAGVVVNEALEIVEFRGKTTDYLEQANGKPSHNLMKMAKKSLAFELRNVIQKAKKDNKAVSREAITLMIDAKKSIIDIEAIPLQTITGLHFLILFKKHNADQKKNEKNSDDEKVSIDKTEKDLKIRDLENELAQLRLDMRVITEDQETVNEELQSTNEELLSGNEELQSLNEELETGKEELQSSNEELTSLNEQINASKLYSESIVSTIREPVLVLDKNLRIKSANASFYSTFKVTKEYTEGILIYDLAGGQWNIPALRTLLEALLPEQTVIKDFEVTHNFQNIGERVMLLNALQLIRGKEEEKLILLAIEDITERTQLQLIKGELLVGFQSLVMQAPVAMMILKGDDYTIELANTYFLNLVQKDSSIVNRPLFQSLPEFLKHGVKNDLDEVKRTGIPYIGREEEIIFKRTGSESGIFNLVYQPLHEQDRTISGIIIVAIEVTDFVKSYRKIDESEKRYHELIYSSPSAIAILEGKNMLISIANDAILKTWNKKKDCIGKSLLSLLPELKQQGFDKMLTGVYLTGESVHAYEREFHLEVDGKINSAYYNFIYQALRNMNDEITGVAIIANDVTEQVVSRNKINDIQREHSEQLENQVMLRTQELSDVNETLLNKNVELERMNSELESFNYIASHDLQEPLRKIQIFSNILSNSEYDVLSAEGKDYFSRINTSAQRMRTLIQDLLTYSRATIIERKVEDCDFDKIVEEVQMDYAELLKETGASLKASELGGGQINGFQFRQIINNLVSNALKFAKPGIPSKIVISSFRNTGKYFKKQVCGGMDRMDEDLMYCRIRCRDNGIGFDPEFSNKIFEVFQRLHTKEQFVGTGIGLAIVKKIVESIKGVIIASSEVGKGSTFDIFIPVITPENK